MKKYFLYALLAALPIAFISCNDDDDDNGGKEPAALKKELAQESKAVDLNFASEKVEQEGEQEEQEAEGQQSLPFDRLILDETGHAIGTPKEAQVIDAAKTRGGGSDVFVGTYTTEDNTYIVFDEKGDEYFRLVIVPKGEGNLVSVTVTLKGQAPFTQAAEQGEKIETDFTKTLCRIWKVKASRLRHKKTVAAVKQFSGCNLNEILEYAKTQAEINEDLGGVENYVVDNIIFTRSGSFVILFKNGKHYVGTWKKGSGDTFTYGWDSEDMGNKFMAGDALFNILEGYYCVTLSAKIDDDMKEGTYYVELSLFLVED